MPLVIDDFPPARHGVPVFFCINDAVGALERLRCLSAAGFTGMNAIDTPATAIARVIVARVSRGAAAPRIADCPTEIAARFAQASTGLDR